MKEPIPINLLTGKNQETDVAPSASVRHRERVFGEVPSVTMVCPECGRLLGRLGELYTASASLIGRLADACNSNDTVTFGKLKAELNESRLDCYLASLEFEEHLAGHATQD